MLILTALSGIQEFLFDVRESGGKQAQSLRFRSFRIQLIAECIAQRLLRAVGLSREKLLFCTAGKAVIDGRSLPDDAPDKLHEELRHIERWLLEHTNGRLRVGLTIEEESDDPGGQYRNALRKLQAAKLRGWSTLAVSGEGWAADRLLGDQPQDADEEAEYDRKHGEKLLRSSWLAMAPANGRSDPGEDVVGLRVAYLRDEPPAEPSLLHAERLDRLARHVPRDRHGKIIEFIDLAEKHARGGAYLGVLKADADSLGQAVQRRLRGAADLEPMRRFSQRLDGFFGKTLDAEMRKPEWDPLYTVFSGGDDLLLVGPWNIAIDFAAHLRRLFDREFGSGSDAPGEPLTISAAVALIKPKFPIRLAARQAEQLLEQAKIQAAPHAPDPKDQMACLGQIWKWSDHQRIIAAGKQLVDWVDAGIVQRGWLHTLLELAMLRRGETPGTTESQEVMATAHLAYHVGRNWPCQDAREPSHQKAREWIDAILDDFDTPRKIETLYLPAILRYATLATRHHAQENDDE